MAGLKVLDVPSDWKDEDLFFAGAANPSRYGEIELIALVFSNCSNCNLAIKAMTLLKHDPKRAGILLNILRAERTN